MTPPGGQHTPRADETLLATIRERCPEAETAMAAHVTDTLTLLLPRVQGRTVTEAGVDDLLDTPFWDAILAAHGRLAHSRRRRH